MAALPEKPLHSLTLAAGTLLIWLPAPTVMVTEVTGVLSDDGAAAFEAAMLRQTSEHGRYLGFHDWEQMNDYDPAARRRLTRAALEIRHVTDATHFLLRSKVVAFGVQLANVVLGSLTVQPTRAAFDRLLAEAIRTRRAR